jgi:hypothetical protein
MSRLFLRGFFFLVSLVALFPLIGNYNLSIRRDLKRRVLVFRGPFLAAPFGKALMSLDEF